MFLKTNTRNTHIVEKKQAHSPYERCRVSIVSSFRHFQINFQHIFSLINIYKFDYGLTQSQYKNMSKK